MSPSPYVKDKHDIGILRTDGTTKVGLMLIKDKNGTPRYGIFDDEYLAAQYFSGAPDYGNLPPEKELAIRQDDWRAGFGQEFYDSADATRYYKSDGMDMRFKNMAVAGASITAVSLPAYSYVVPTGVSAGTTWTAQATAYNGNTADGSGWGNLVHATYTDFFTLTIPSTECDAIRVWWNSSGAGGTPSTVVDLDVLAGTAVTHVFEDVVAKGEYVTKTFTAQAVTSFRFRVLGADATDTEDIVLYELQIRSVAPLGTVLKGVEYNNSHYIARYNSLLKLDAAGTSASFVKDYYPGVFTGIVPFADDFLYLAAGTGQAYCYCNTAETFVISDRTVNTFQHFVPVYAATTVLWGDDGVNIIRSNANPDNSGDQWAGTTTVASSFHVITGLHSDLGALYITKTDLPYYLNSAGAVRNDLAPDLASETHKSDNGKNACFWQGNFYLPWGDQTLLEYDAGTNTFLNPADYCTNLAAFNGQVLAVAGDNRYLHAVLNNRVTGTAIDVGSAATDRDTYANDSQTLIDLANAANTTGIITSIEVWALSNITGLRVGTFYLVSGTTYKCRDSVTIGSVTAGSKQTITVDSSNNPLALQVQVGDFIGCYFTGGTLESGSTGGSGLRYVTGEYMDVGDSVAFSLSAGYSMSLYGIGVIPYVEVVAGRHESIDGSVRWVWHPIAETVLTGCNSAWINSIPQKRLWISSTYNSDSLYYIKLPAGYGNIATDTNRKFKTGVTFTTSWLHGNFKSTNKAFPSLELVMGHTYNANVYFTVEYQKLGDSTWTSIGNYTGSATSMTESKYIPNDASANHPVSTLFRLRFTAVTNDTTITPILLSYHLKGILYPPQREIIACQVYCSNEISLKDGTFDKGSFDTIVATLNEARTATWPVTFYDISGDTKTIKPLPLPSGTKRWDLIVNEKSRTQERVYNLLMQIVNLS